MSRLWGGLSLTPPRLTFMVNRTKWFRGRGPVSAVVWLYGFGDEDPIQPWWLGVQFRVKGPGHL